MQGVVSLIRRLLMKKIRDSESSAAAAPTGNLA
jgi:hypothetical protein